ncbi:hypothetical protein, partial [Mesorhizobium sp. M5C.F.Ca.IN.020.29.1.1]|uniref:hypothetical protein n=1 Tax=Mesorhizobium sp. M5C.F.Ca.IN.020.29.1.1 TaxID=2496770 RepID=UPI0019D1E0D9
NSISVVGFNTDLTAAHQTFPFFSRSAEQPENTRVARSQPQISKLETRNGSYGNSRRPQRVEKTLVWI